ncbi:hypothetical protein KO481_34670 [Nocardia sp. NEAU-G5]|uniref:Lipoprotein n=1 Tax=Nocardia albiluteola TaxID=2842303 RepID=A0ABS6B8L2_9NOCA|nr:hypothetical protein [Nocardia albiluteola]MBU3066648.1 hypothetical protein [Nocardia albiluteola]
MHSRWFPIVACLLLGSAAACSNSHSSVPSVAAPNVHFKQMIPLPNLPAGGKFSYDIGTVDPATHQYYLADRTNSALDIIDTTSFALRQVSGFTGAKATSDLSGPDGVVSTPGGVYVGDINAVKVVDPAAGTTSAPIATGSAGFRTDEGCYDPADKLMMFANPADSPPNTTWISTTTNTVKATHAFADSKGLEQCAYDPGTKNFFINNDGTQANPHGELDVISAASVVAGTPAVSATYTEGACGPTGMALGPNENLVVGCDAAPGSPQITLIVSATNGSIVKTITSVGGSDEVAYDSKLNRYYTASRNWTANGTSQTGVKGAKFTPVLGIIDAGSNTWIANLPTVSDAHSVAVDSNTGNVFVPVAPTATAAGGVMRFGL